MVSPHAHNEIHIQHTRGIILRIVFGTQFFVVISTSQSTKHRVTLFHYVVLADICIFLTRSSIGLRLGAKLRKRFGSAKGFREKVKLTLEHRATKSTVKTQRHSKEV